MTLAPQTVARRARGVPGGAEMDALVHGRHGDPFAVLGPHDGPEGRAVRVFAPGAEAVSLVSPDDGRLLARLDEAHPAGLWSGLLASVGPYRVRVAEDGGTRTEPDVYAFGPSLGSLDLHLLGEGRHEDLGHTLGAQFLEHEGAHGVRFAVWAPNARRVSVVGAFNGWDGRRHPMRHHAGAGVWELFIPGLQPGMPYKYEMLGPDR